MILVGEASIHHVLSNFDSARRKRVCCMEPNLHSVGVLAKPAASCEFATHTFNAYVFRPSLALFTE